MEKNAMQLGVEVLGWTPQPEKYKNDNIHPCVRYIPNGFNGHQWWMVTTPYYLTDGMMENPILYWGDSREGDLPPLEWQGGIVIDDTPPSGYNSDGGLYWDGIGLWVYWRANRTPDVIEANVGGRATLGRYTTDGVNFTEKKILAPLGFDIEGKAGDSEMCPIIVNFDGQVKLYGACYEYTPVRRPHGLAIWDIADNDLANNRFELSKVVGLLYPKDFNFWHFDVFQHEDKYYCVTSAEYADQILLGVSDDGENFQFWELPLLSSDVSGARKLYKPTAMVHQGILYVWHPNLIDSRSRIFMSERPFNEVLDILNNSISKIG